MGDSKQTAAELNALFDKDTTKKAKQAVEEWVELVRLRREALVEFSDVMGKKLIENIKEHLRGEMILVYRKASNGQLKPKAKVIGIHSYFEYIKGKIRFRDGKPTIPPNPKINEPFIAFVQMYSDTAKMWFNKTNSSLKNQAGKGDRTMSTMFPMNWDEERIMEEIAFAWKDMTKVNSMTRKDGIIVDTYIGKSTIGFDIEIYFSNNIFTTAAPKIII